MFAGAKERNSDDAAINLHKFTKIIFNPTGGDPV